MLIHPPIVSKWSDWSLPDITGVMKRSRTAYGFCIRAFLGPDFPLVERRHSNKTNFDIYKELDYKVVNTGEDSLNETTITDSGETKQETTQNGHSSTSDKQKEESDPNFVSKIAEVNIIQGNEDIANKTDETKGKLPKFLKTVYKKYFIQNPRPLDRYYILPSYKVNTKPLAHVLVNHYKKSAIMNENLEVITTTPAPTTEKTYWNSNNFTDYKEEYRKWYHGLLNAAVKNQTGIKAHTYSKASDDVWHHVSVNEVFKNGVVAKPGKYGSNPKSYGSSYGGQQVSGGSYGTKKQSGSGYGGNYGDKTSSVGSYGSPLISGSSYGTGSRKSYGPISEIGANQANADGHSGGYGSPFTSSGETQQASIGQYGSLPSPMGAGSRHSSNKLPENTMNVHSIKALSNYSTQDTPEDIEQRKKYLKTKKDFSDIFSILTSGNALPPPLPGNGLLGGHNQNFYPQHNLPQPSMQSSSISRNFRHNVQNHQNNIAHASLFNNAHHSPTQTGIHGGNNNSPFNWHSRGSQVPSGSRHNLQKLQKFHGSHVAATANGRIRNNRPQSSFSVYPPAPVPQHYRYPPAGASPVSRNVNNNNSPHTGQLSFPVVSHTGALHSNNFPISQAHNPKPSHINHHARHHMNHFSGTTGVGQHAFGHNNADAKTSFNKNKQNAESPFDKMRNDKFLASRGGFDNIFSILSANEHLTADDLHHLHRATDNSNNQFGVSGIHNHVWK